MQAAPAPTSKAPRLGRPRSARFRSSRPDQAAQMGCDDTACAGSACTTPLAEHRCPLCGGPNGCAPAASGHFDGPCWCTTVHFRPEIRALIPSAQRNKACLCQRCAEGESMTHQADQDAS
ncbi:MAG: cysteine-rich CWC family protein [Leptothrix ochracea]|uniref:cysteine-rich CWC family protein n=1 Tax=Leptothrix ochracea TaxID=735331 RepID=UPI0034E1D8FB